jgi:hypothetical protein
MTKERQHEWNSEPREMYQMIKTRVKIQNSTWKDT